MIVFSRPIPVRNVNLSAFKPAKASKKGKTKFNSFDYKVEEINPESGIGKYMEPLDSSRTLLRRLAMWIRSSTKYFYRRITEEMALDIATKVLNQCDTPNDSMLLSFNDGEYSAILVRTRVGYNFISYAKRNKLKQSQLKRRKFSADGHIYADDSIYLKNQLLKYIDYFENKANWITLLRWQALQNGEEFDEEAVNHSLQLDGINACDLAMLFIKVGLGHKIQETEKIRRRFFYVPLDFHKI
ncbi:hypothetical protein D5018_09865 [Parashewanella curva]|uniref:Uncharacterized protein n=1 Tax=Parashewanella curva TaxID=2338552 RepID=A0A3L8PWN8_9GAMM|nr:hypothetical protein [Parashewanella curva]RLV59867.1 hypothetical protein D5018_09865 [Parashewanella curva]